MIKIIISAIISAVILFFMWKHKIPIFAMMARSSLNINPLGGNLMWATKLDNTFTLVTPVDGTTGIDFGELESESNDIIASSTDSVNTQGQVTYTAVTFKGNVDATLQERDKKKQDFLAYTMRTGIWLVCHNAGLVNGKMQETFMIVKPLPGKSVKAQGADKSLQFKGVKQKNQAAITISGANLTAIAAAYGITISAPGPVTIPAGQEDVLIET